jgi:hypothetical protein
VNSGSDNCTGMGVIAGFLAEVRLMSGPHVKDVDPHWKIRFLHILQEVRPVCKTRNQFTKSDGMRKILLTHVNIVV